MYSVPKVYHKILSRPRINRIIDSASINQIICIIAPYGYGKTLSVISWLKNRQAIWIDLESISVNAESLYELLSRMISQEIQSDETETEPSILVIDNFRFISDIEKQRLIKDFIDRYLGKIRIFIISRVEPPPIFNSLMLKGQICLITAEDLAFDTEEISGYFLLNERKVPVIDIIKLSDETEGWPAALNVALTVSRGNSISYNETCRSYVMDFFENEIWHDLDEPIKDFLLKTSVLEKLTPAACRPIMNIGGTLPILNWLYRNGMFISKLDERDTYRYHKVFKSYLSYKLTESDIDTNKLYMNAGWWLYEHGEAEKALPYFIKSKDLYGLNQVIMILNLSDMGIEKFLESTESITQLNIAELQKYPIIVARMALIWFLKGNIEQMQALYRTFTGWISSGTLPITPIEYAECLWEAGWLCYLDPSEEVRNNEKHEQWTNYIYYAPHLKALHKGRAAAIRPPSVLRGIRDYSSVITSIGTYVASFESQTVISDESTIWEIQLIFAEYLYEIEDFKRSEEILRHIMTLLENDYETDLYFAGTSVLVKLLRALNMPKEINFMIERLELMILNQNLHCMLPNFHAFQQRNLLIEGKHEFTEVFETENSKHAEKPYFYQLYRNITLARVMIAMSNYNEALLLIGRLDIMCVKYSRVMDLIELNILKSICYYRLDNNEKSCTYLTQAINEGKNYGYIRIFSDEAKDIWPILELVSKNITGNYIDSIILSCKKSLIYTGHRLREKKSTASELTKTELKILKSLQIGISYKEIALDNGIKISTVKSHVHSIYSKLDVYNRTSAVLAAEELGLLAPIPNRESVQNTT